MTAFLASALSSSPLTIDLVDGVDDGVLANGSPYDYAITPLVELPKVAPENRTVSVMLRHLRERTWHTLYLSTASPAFDERTMHPSRDPNGTDWHVLFTSSTYASYPFPPPSVSNFTAAETSVGDVPRPGVVAVHFRTADATGPRGALNRTAGLHGGQIDEVTSSSFRLSRALDESGKYVFVVVPAGQNAPTINDVLRLRGAGDASPLACGVVQVPAGYVEANRTIFGRPLLRVNKSKTDASVDDFFYGMDVESGETRASSQTLSRQCFERKVPIIAATTSVDRIDRSFYGLGSFTADTDSTRS